MISNYIKIYKNPNKEGLSQRLCVSIGVFDGLHKGHKKVLARLIDVCEKYNCSSVVLTFNKNPKDVFINSGDNEIITNEKKYQEIFSMGVDYIYELDFTNEVRNISGEDFLKELFDSYKIEKIVVGSDFKCGNINSQMDIEQIRAIYKDKLDTVENVCYDGRKISSSMLRKIIKEKGFFDKNDLKNYF